MRITYPIRVRSSFAGIMRRLGGNGNPVRQKKIQLDELGTAVWDLIDGNRSVQRIIREFAKKYSLNAKEAELSVTHFLRLLGRRGIIGLK